MTVAPPEPNSTAASRSIELHGIDLIPDNERTGKARNLFGMWLGTNLNVFYIVNGAVVISLGLSFTQSVITIVVANLAFFAVGAASLQGPVTGTSSFAVSRASFGPNGGRLLALFNWITCVGFEASGLALIVLAVIALIEKAGYGVGTPAKLVVILAAAAVQAALPLLGHRTILTVQRRLAWISAPLFVVMAAMSFGHVHLSEIATGHGWAPVTLAIALLVSGGGLSWANTGSDYSRYLPATTSRSGVFWWTSLGGYIPAVLLEILGATMASGIKNASDPISGVPQILPGWVTVPYLLLVAVTLLAVNTINLYSSGLTLQAIGLSMSRWKCVAVDSIICTVVCIATIFSDSFNTVYTQFLGLLIVWLGPWFAVYIVDYWMRRGVYDAPALMDVSSSGKYWGRAGFSLPGIAAQALGMVAALMWINSSAYVGPLSHAFSSTDLSIITGTVVAGLSYWVLGLTSVRAQVGGAAIVESSSTNGAGGARQDATGLSAIDTQ